MGKKENEQKMKRIAFYISVYRPFVEKVYNTFEEVFNEKTYNLKILRQDKESLSANTPQIQKVMDNIKAADVIFCILSYTSIYVDKESDEARNAPSPLANANVYFELGYAIALKKKVFLFLDEGRKQYETPPFNIKSFSIIEYTEGNLKAVLTRRLIPDLKKEFSWFNQNHETFPSVSPSSKSWKRGIFVDVFENPGKK